MKIESLYVQLYSIEEVISVVSWIKGREIGGKWWWYLIRWLWYEKLLL